MAEPEATTEEWVQNEDLVQAHYSSLTLHRKCPQAWYYRYELGLRRPVTGPAPELHFGSWWGALRTADSLQRGRAKDSLLFKPRKFSPVDGGPKFDQATLTTKDVIGAANEWWAKQDDLTKEMWLERLGEPLPRRLLGAYTRWRDEWADELKHEKPLGVEVFWERSLPRPTEDSAWEIDGDPLRLEGLPQMRLIGFIDEVYFDEVRGMVVVRDNKSSKQLASQTSLDDMMDSQLQLYAWGATPLLQELGAGQPRVVAYDRIKSSAPTKPQLTLAGKLSLAVTQFDLKTYMDWATEDTRPTEEIAQWLAEAQHGDKSVSEEQLDAVRVLSETPGRMWGKFGEFFVTGAKKGVPKFGIYEPDDGMIEKLKSKVWRSAFHQRTVTPLSRHVVRAHLRAAVDTATDIWRTQKRAQVTMEAARNLSKTNCQWCDYASICRAQMVGGPEGEYDLREHNLVSREGKVTIG